MKAYWEIPGPKQAPKGLPCIAFEKLDGNNIRAEWRPKSGWDKFGSREVLISSTGPLGSAVALFLNKYSDAISKIFHDNKDFRSIQSAIAFLEYFGPSSFAGIHDPNDKMDIVLFDVNIHKKGILPPRDFLRAFGHLHVPQVVYEGNFGSQFIQDVKEGKYSVKEGVVAKGVKPGKGQHGLWFAKVKTQAWLDRLKQQSVVDSRLNQALADNLREQSAIWFRLKRLSA